MMPEGLMYKKLVNCAPTVQEERDTTLTRGAHVVDILVHNVRGEG
jgi:hypothetical protein